MRIYELEDASASAADAEKKRNDAYSDLERAINNQKEIYKTQIDAVKATISTLQNLFEFLDKSVNSLYASVTSTASMTYSVARKNVSEAYRRYITTGEIPSDRQGFQESVNYAIGGINPGDFATKVDYDRERLRLAAELSVMRDGVKKSLTHEQQILQYLEDQIKQLDNTLAFWRKQIDIANGTYKTIVSIEDAIKKIKELLTPESVSPGGNGQTGSNEEVVGPSDGSPGRYSPSSAGKHGGKWYREINLGTGTSIQEADSRTSARLDSLYTNVFKKFEGTGDVAGYLQSIRANGGTLLDASTLGGWSYSDMVRVAKELGIERFEKGGVYPGGIAMVGERGPELINFNKPGYVHTAAQTASIMSGTNDSRIAALEVKQERMIQLLNSIADNTKRASDTLRNVTPNGDSINVTTVA